MNKKEKPLNEKFSTEPNFSEFDAITGNPPYQIDVQKNERRDGTLTRTSKDVFQEFQYIYSSLGERTLFIYPKSWMKTFEKGLGEFLINNGLYEVVNVDAGFPIPVSIVSIKKNYSNKIKTSYGVIDRKHKSFPERHAGVILSERTKKFKKFPGIEKSPTWNNHFDHKELFTETETSNKIWLKQRPGKQGDSRWFYIKDTVDLSEYSKNKFKIAVMSRFFGRQMMMENRVINRRGGISMNARLFMPNEFFGATWGQMRSFEVYEEAKNFLNYVNTKTVAELIYLDYSRKSFASHVPDLEDYTNDNPLFKSDDELGVEHEYYGLTLDERLYRFFGLTDEEINVVEKV